MTQIRVKRFDISFNEIRNGFDRKATLFCNNIIEEIKKIKLNRDFIKFPETHSAHRREFAKVILYYNHHKLIFTHNSQKRFVDNLFIVSKLIEFEIKELNEKNLTSEKFISKYQEEHVEGGKNDKKAQNNLREESFKILNLEEQDFNLENLNNNYKKLARKHHPDLNGGDTTEFTKINKAHKLLKKELE